MQKPGGYTLFGIPRDLAVVGVAVFIWGLGEGLFIYFYPLALQYWGSNPIQIGGLLSLIGVTMAIVQVPAGYLSDRFGTRPLMRAAWIMGFASALLMAIAPNLTVFVAGLMMYGFTSFVSAPLNSYATSKREGWSVQRALTFITAAMQLGAIAGPVIGGWIGETTGIVSVFRYSAGLFLLSTLVLFLARRATSQDQQDVAIHTVSPLANPRFFGMLVIIFVTIFAINLPQQLASLYLKDVHHFSIQQIGMTGTIAGIGNTVIMFAFGGLRATTGMLTGQLLVMAFSLLLWRGQSTLALFSGYLFSGGYRLYHSMALALARPLVKATDIGLAYGMVETGNALAVILSPIAAGVLYNYRPEAVFIASLGATIMTIALNALLLPKRHTIAATEEV